MNWPPKSDNLVQFSRMFSFRSTLTFFNKFNIHRKDLKFITVIKQFPFYIPEFFHKNERKKTLWIYRPKSDNLVQFSRMFEFRSTLTFCNKFNIHCRHLKFAAVTKPYLVYSLEFSHKNKRKRTSWIGRRKVTTWYNFQERFHFDQLESWQQFRWKELKEYFKTALERLFIIEWGN